MRLAVLLLALFAVLPAACRQTLDVPRSMQGVPEKPAAQMDLRREYWDGGPNPKQLRHEVEGLAEVGGGFVKHGRERTFYRYGAPETERHWVRGEPAGTWLAWYEDGTQRSECSFTKDGTPTSMSFWHSNGQLEGYGQAINGRRVGKWEFFHPSGAPESAGEYVDGERSGAWIFWDQEGAVVEAGKFERGTKVGEWIYR